MEATQVPLPMVNNTALQRFEMPVEGLVTFANYRIEGRKLWIDYVEAPPELRGSGVAGRLMQEILRYAEAEGLSIVPICGYAAAWLARHRLTS